MNGIAAAWIPGGEAMSTRRQRIGDCLVAAIAATIIFSVECRGAPAMPTDACFVEVVEHGVSLSGPSFAFRLDTSDGLRAASWVNRLTGRTFGLGSGPEVAFEIGLPEGPLTTPALRVAKMTTASEGSHGEVVFELEADGPRALVTVTYRWDAAQPVLRKFVTIVNQGDQPWDRLLNVRLGSYATRDVRVTDRPASRGHSVNVPRALPSPESTRVERGFPVYVADELFLTLAHPSGVAEGSSRGIALRQYPGARIEPGEAFHCMEVVYGMARSGGARPAFLAHVTSRMRRVVCGHDKPYAIFEPFGARPGGSFQETEEFILDSIEKVATGQRESGCHFDLYSVDFWVDYRGTLKECDPERFPNGLTKIRAELDKMGTAMGLWIDSSWEAWSIGGNPQVQNCLNIDPQQPETARQRSWGRKSFCRATEPIRSMYTQAFRYHIREHGVRLVKFDNMTADCVNPTHDHLPGLYSNEPIYDAVIEFLHALDAECPDVFLMLYWGYRSPWWLLHGDTLFDSGLGIEAASPSTLPAPYARASVTHKLDQAQWHASDVPALGKDSLGVWLSDWGWNSQIGKERWQEGFVMDLCRGSLLAQPWSDTPWLTPPERRQMSELIALLKARPECFRNPRFVVGNPQHDEPYGYCCTDGTRAFVALHNCSWQDRIVTLQLNPNWGLPRGRAWDLYRWYPDPAKLESAEGRLGPSAPICLRPFQVALLEVAPLGEAPALPRPFEAQPIPVRFDVASREVPVEVRMISAAPDSRIETAWTVLRPTRVGSRGGAALTVQPDGSVLASGETPSHDTYIVEADTELTGITAVRLEAQPHDSLPCGGPGRAVNGNFCLTGLRVRAYPRGRPKDAARVALHNSVASFSQTSYGGWPVAAALDGDPKTGWSIDPEESRPHEAAFELRSPVEHEGGTTLVVELGQGERQHSFGRFRLAVTAGKPPVSVRHHQPDRPVVAGRTPASPVPGRLVVTAEMRRGGEPYEQRNIGQQLAAEGSLGGQRADWQPVLGLRTYPSCWQAWRLPVGPATEAQPFELTVTPKVGGSVQLEYRAYFVPG